MVQASSSTASWSPVSALRCKTPESKSGRSKAKPRVSPGGMFRRSASVARTWSLTKSFRRTSAAAGPELFSRAKAWSLPFLSSARLTPKATTPTLAASERPTGTKVGSRLPNSNFSTAGKRPSLKMKSFVPATRMSVEFSFAWPGLTRPAANLRASERFVECWLGLIAARASRSCWRLSVKFCSTRAVSEKLISMAESPECIWSIRSPTRRLASSSRLGLTSVACMLAELSIRTTSRLPERRRACQLGRSTASTIKSTTASCRYSSRLFRSRCQIELTCRSSTDLCQR